MQVVKELEEINVGTASFPRRRIVVLRRDDGNYTFAEQYHYTNEFEGDIIAEGWQTLPASGVHATAEIAEVEGRAALRRWHGLKD